MTVLTDDIGELDLMAYADGLLDHDPRRKAAVADWLASRPSQARRVAAIVADNEAIRTSFRDELERPVPPRLLAAARQGRHRGSRRPRSLAAGIAIAAVFAVSGWLVGQRDDGDDDIAQADGFLQQVADKGLPGVDSRWEPGTAIESELNSAGASVLSGVAGDIAVGVRIPDLSAQGLHLTSREIVSGGETEMARLRYRSGDTAVDLYMRVRADEDGPQLKNTRAHDRLIYYWSSGPFLYAMTSDADDAKAPHLARAVRDAVRDARFIDRLPTTVVTPGSGAEAVVSGHISPSAPAPEDGLTNAVN